MKKGKVLNKLKKLLITITCFIVVVVSMPVKSHAGIFLDIVDVLLKIPDAIMWMENMWIAGWDFHSSEAQVNVDLKGIHMSGDDGTIYNFFVTPYDIFTNGEIRTYKDSLGHEKNYRNLPIFYVNFFTNDNTTADNDDQTLRTNEILRPVVSNIYKSLRNLAIVVMMLVLLYIGIKIIISSAKTEQSKYKQMLIDWVVGLCLLFMMHYIMSAIMNFTEIVVDLLRNDESNYYYISFGPLGKADVAGSGFGEEWYEFFEDHNNDTFIDLHLDIPGTATAKNEWQGSSGAEGTTFASSKNTFNNTWDSNTATLQVDTHTDWGNNGRVRINAMISDDDPDKHQHICIYKANLIEYTRTLSSYSQKFIKLTDSDNQITSMKDWFVNSDDLFRAGMMALYVGLFIQTIMFTVIYFKRALQMAFYTMIAPLVAFMYPLDKVGDGQAQAFNTWLKDYIFNALLQPFHLLLYTIFISAATELFEKNIIYAIAVYAFMIPAEKYIKKILGFEKASSGGGGPMGGPLGMLGMDAFRRLSGLGPGGGRGRSGKESRKPRFRTTPLGGSSTPSGDSGGVPGGDSGRAPGGDSGRSHTRVPGAFGSGDGSTRQSSTRGRK